LWLPPTKNTRANLHVVLCLSAVGDAFRERCRLFPGLVNCTTIDWFTEWPADALYEVASRQMAGEALSEEVKQSVCKVCVEAGKLAWAQPQAAAD
jgi:dynein heavy chain